MFLVKNISGAQVRQTGFTLIEVLVTMVIVSVGLLALVSLMLRGLQSSSDSVTRSIAIEQAYDMADRMRANMGGVQAGAYDALSNTTACTTLNPAAATNTAIVAAPGTAPTCTALCTSGACSATALRDADACSWNRDTYRVLPRGAGAVCKTSTAAQNWYTIFVSWDEAKAGSNNRTFMMRFEP